MNLRKDHSHTSTYFTVNFLCELLYGGWGDCRTLVHQFAGSGAALEMLPLLRSYRYRCATQLCLALFLMVVSGPSFFGTQLSATDVSARTTMKGAAKCDKHCELQNSVNQQVLERILRFRDIPESMPASVSTHSHSQRLLRVSARHGALVPVTREAHPAPRDDN